MGESGPGQLAGKVAVITGATAGIGLAIAKRFVAEGAYVFITGRRQPALDAATREIGRNVTGVRGDASLVPDLDRLFAVIGEHGRGVDVLVANAGGGGGSAQITDITEDGFDASAGLTFRGTYFTVQRALPLLNDGATIVLVSSIAAGNGTAGHGIYNASKAAVRSLARTLTVELKGRGIRVNAVSPGPTATQGFAIPINTAISIADEIGAGRASTTVHIGLSGFMGVNVANANAPSNCGTDAGGTGVYSPAVKSGALVCDVYPSAPAAEAGLVGGDVITSVNGTSVTTADGLTDLMTGDHPGSQLSIVYVDQSGARHSTTVTLTEWAK